MTHDVKELRRQYDAAKAKVADARGKEREALERLQEAMIEKANSEFAAQGIKPGQKVRAHRESGSYEVGVYDGCEVLCSYHEEATPIVRHLSTKSGKPHKRFKAQFLSKPSLEAIE